MMKNCIFCQIIAGIIPAEKIYEDEKILAFLDIRPVNYGHTLIIPKTHHALMTDVPDELLKHCFVKAKELMIKIKQALEADYVSVSVIGLDVPHFHIHLIPRYANDGLPVFWPTKAYPEGEMKKTAEKIKKLT
ncbi:MAG: HIT family protein [Candidatus Moranbacteria bacterium CG_4_9_14_3_um_filter_40_7]|nr:MAG: HIT family protein [Candidatus Moranbacteria bacterium CG23_combo_of_CG06-09_8_20_14_all_40_16]PIU80944.1 MAG: HIT family protein [Candidatus Moranbacteria bacterium CG06_land_8_20_14_3_00_40_12]PJA87517.1 MAG: HIT family protein [Candidatus Moranbacteria bacterium CG_4_9_14_3_um_filter_40_7]